MNKYVQQLVIESVVAIKNSKRALSPVPKTSQASPEIKQNPKKQRGKSSSPSPAPVPVPVTKRELPPATTKPTRIQSVTPVKDRDRSRSGTRADSSEPYRASKGKSFRLSPERAKLDVIKEKAKLANRPRPSSKTAKPSQAPGLTGVPSGSTQEITVNPPREASVKPSRARPKSQEESPLKDTTGPTPSGRKARRALSQQPAVTFDTTKNDPYKQMPDS